MQVKSSLKNRGNSILVKRRGVLYRICKKNPRLKGRQG